MSDPSELSCPVRPGGLPRPGLYLFPARGAPIALVAEQVECFAAALWGDPGRLPERVRAAAGFQRCAICPLRGAGGLCDAVRPILATFDQVDDYESFERVTACYRDPDTDRLDLAETDMQGALKYVAMLSLLRFCRIGRHYWRYLKGVTPIMDPAQIAERVYLNIYWLESGDVPAIQRIVRELADHLLVTTRNQQQRMQLICRNDALVNAFVETQVATVYLTRDMKRLLDESFARFSAGPEPGAPPDRTPVP